MLNDDDEQPATWKRIFNLDIEKAYLKRLEIFEMTTCAGGYYADTAQNYTCAVSNKKYNIAYRPKTFLRYQWDQTHR